MITTQDIQMATKPMAAMCLVTKGKTFTGLGWDRRNVCVLRNNHVVSAYGRNNPGSGVT